MKKIIAFFLFYIVGVVSLNADTYDFPWTAPTITPNMDALPTDHNFILYNIEKEMFLTAGTTWGTHASLTSDISSALTYKYIETSSDYNQLEVVSTQANYYLFVSGDATYGANVYTDYYATSPNITYTYFNLEQDGDNGNLIKIATANGWYDTYNDYCLGWHPSNVDIDNNSNSLGTNVGLFMIDPNTEDAAIHWGYLLEENVSLYNAKLQLYDLLCQCYADGETSSSEYTVASEAYNTESSTETDLTNAYNALALVNATYPLSYTSEVTNPTFNGNVTGWTVNVPGAQNKGYQSASYSNGSISISKFAEAWIPSGGYLGAGSILQTLSGLPEGKYILEADVIACDQSGTHSPVTGVTLVAESDVSYSTELSTNNQAPQHYSLSFINSGNSLTVGLRTDEDCTANWLAFDNVVLNYWGPVSCNTTSITVEPAEMEVVVGETTQLTADIETNDEVFQHAIWTSSDESVATVTTNGLVKGVHTGTATITAAAVNTGLTATATITVSKNDVSGLVINEVQVSNIDQTIDPSYNYGGWVELYNPTSMSINLGSLYVSDDKTNLTKFQMPTTVGVVSTGGFKNIWFDHNSADGNFGGESENNVNFKLNAEGGTVYLSDADGELITSLTYPAGVPRCSYARTEDNGTTWSYTGTPTPEATNTTSTFATERMAAPVVSQTGGVYATGSNINFTVEIPSGAALMYTTDGSTPTLENGIESTDGQFSISCTTIFRFALFRDGYLPSPVVTRSFIFKNHDYYLPVISVVTNDRNLYDDEIGIYTKGTNGTSGNGRSDNCNWNRDWERPVNIEYMVPEENEAASFITYLNQETDMEIAGGWTRAYSASTVDGNYWPMQGSFRLKCDKCYESINSLDYPVFPNKPYNKYKVWQVRNGGNDCTARIIDPAINQIVLQSGFYVDTQDAQPAHIFFNGKYLGMFNIRESNNRHYGESNYGIDTDDMDQFDLSNAQYNQKVGDRQAWEELLSLASSLYSTHSEDTWNEICNRLDMDEYINYMALECFIGSSDWILNTNNVKGFRSRSDGKFHFVLFDTDAAFSTSSMLSSLASTSAGVEVADLFQHLYTYPAFQRQFIDAFSIVDGSVFEPTRCNKIIEDWYNNTNTALGFESKSSNTNLESRISSYHNGSPISNMKSFLGLPTGYYLNLSSNISSARLSLNGQVIPTGKFNGYAFNYNSNGIYLTAKAPAGYTFHGWKQDGYSASGEATTSSETVLAETSYWDYYDQGSMDSYEWTSSSFNASSNGWSNSQAPFGYASSTAKTMYSTSNTILDYGTSSSDKRPTYYFRNAVSLAQTPTSNETYTLHYKVDDGLRIHINGSDVGGYHCNEGATYSSYSTTYEGDTPYEGTLDITSSLTKGTNIIAIDVHNTSASSSDIYFEGWITKTTTTSPSGEDDNIISKDENFCLTDAESAGTYTITAVYAPIEGDVARNEAGATPIRINEVSAGNDITVNEFFKKEDWVELYNTTSDSVDVAGMYLSDNQKKPQKWQIRSDKGINTKVPPHGTLIVWCDDLEPVNQLHAPFKLDNADGACVSIQAEDGRWADRLTYLCQPRWYTYGRYPDGGNHEQLLAQPTINAQNRIGLYDYTNITDGDFLSDDITVTLAMAEGWNWTSHNLAEDVDCSRFTSFANIIRGQGCELYNDDILGWQGRLNTLDAAHGYKVQMRESADITLRGDLYQHTTPVSLVQGWNWIGCPLSNTTTLEAALQNYMGTEGDQLVGQDAFATYTEGSWTGTLTTLSPGQAYLLKTGQAQSFCWNALSDNNVRQRRYVTARREESSPWEYNIHAYPNVMTLIAQVDTHNIDLTGGYYVGAFVDDECRGVGRMVDDRLFLNIHGEGGEVINFRLLDANGDTYTAQRKLQLQAQQGMGTMSAPYLINFQSSDVVDVMAGTPNIHVVTTQYYNLNGLRITHPSGFYLLKSFMNDGTILVQKIYFNK